MINTAPTSHPRPINKISCLCLKAYLKCNKQELNTSTHQSNGNAGVCVDLVGSATSDTLDTRHIVLCTGRGVLRAGLSSDKHNIAVGGRRGAAVGHGAVGPELDTLTVINTNCSVKEQSE